MSDVTGPISTGPITAPLTAATSASGSQIVIDNAKQVVVDSSGTKVTSK